MVKQPSRDIDVYEHKVVDSQEKIFEIDRIGDRDNRFYGSMYAHDQPSYELATRRDLLTGSWTSSIHYKNSGRSTGKEGQRTEADRYFSVEARRMERNARQRRLYLAYSEKRLARAKENSTKAKPEVPAGNKSVGRSSEMAFIPLDPEVDISALVDVDGLDFDSHATGETKRTEGLILTDTQSVEQHLVERGKMFNAALSANPQSIDTWLDFIAFQEQSLCLHAKVRKISPAVKASVEEKQAAILDKALASNPQSRVLHRVKLNMLFQAQPGNASSDFDSIQRKLEDLLSRDTTNSELWLKLIQTRQQHFSEFSMQSVRDLYARILAVLRAEIRSTVKPAGKMAALDRNGESEGLSDRSQELWKLLLDFHFLMCTFERKAGYIERSITELQALIDFSLMVQNKRYQNGDCPPHLELLQMFALEWDKEGSFSFGDKKSGKPSRAESDALYLPTMASFDQYIEAASANLLKEMNPPEVLQTEQHKRSILLSSATYQRRANKKISAKKCGNNESRGLEESDEEGQDLKQGSRRIYSNLHGYRINVDDADDSKEYQRILGELRGTESSRAKQALALERDSRKQAALAGTVSELEDQRVHYRAIDETDTFTRWAIEEEKLSRLQWAPLRSSNPLHQELIEEQPDRATLTEEIRPFLFPVPVDYQWRLIAELLNVCGVQWSGETGLANTQQARESIYADSAEDCELLVAPILAALDPHHSPTKKQTLFLSFQDRKTLLEKALLEDVKVNPLVLHDPTRVEFIRRVFEQALDVLSHYPTQGHDFRSAVKCLWIGFEAEITRESNDTKSSLAHARRLCQQLAQMSSSDDTDFDVLFAYAKLELKMGNDRQVKRICDNTLESLGHPSDPLQSRTFHRFVFLRARSEMWSSKADLPGSHEQRGLRCLYTLWHAWHFGSEVETLETLTKEHRKGILPVLKQRLTSDPSTEACITTKYRSELVNAMHHCSENCKNGHVADRSRSHTTCWTGYCLHNLVLVIYTYRGFNAACQEYRAALKKVEYLSCPHYQWMWTCFLEFMQQHQVLGFFPSVAPRVWRDAVGKAVDLFPGTALFLRLFVDAESGNTISQVLRNYFLRLEKRWQRHFDSPELVEWLFALLCELCRIERATILLEAEQVGIHKPSRNDCCLFHYWGMNTTAIRHIRQVFEDMVSHIRTKGNALCWRLYLRFEVALGRVDAAKKVFYRGIAACAWSKQLYMDGIRVLRPYLSEDECQELFDFMESKAINLRVELDCEA